MTIRELQNAQNGFNKNQETQIQEYMIGVRMICYWVVKPNLKKNSRIKPQDLFELPIDKEVRKQRLKNVKPIKLIRNDH